MLRTSVIKAVLGLGFVTVLLVAAPAQEAGVQNRSIPLMNGVYVTPVPNVPFSATVVWQSTRALQDGTTESLRAFHNIARDSRGRIYNERRRLVPVSFPGTSQLLSVHIYDPQTRLNTFLDPMNHIARQSTLKGLAPDFDHSPGPPRALAPAQAGGPSVRREDLGAQVMENLTVKGERISRTVPADVTGTGHPLVVTDEYWYSDDLRMNILIKHNDPRTGEQTLTVKQIKSDDPDPQMFQVPSDYKLAVETPEPPDR